jgi:hypothetical protein
MKKIFMSLFILGSMSMAAISQNTFNKGDKVVNLGIGFGSMLYSGAHYTSKTPPISGSFEIGVKDKLFDDKSSLGVGGYVGYTGAKWQESGWGWKYSSIVVGGRAALHYQIIDNFDTYTGLMLGYNIVSSSAIGSTTYGSASATASGLAYSWFVGGRYYFSDNIAGLVELGYGVAFINLGLAFKF